MAWTSPRPKFAKSLPWRWVTYGPLINSGASWALTPWRPSSDARVTPPPIEQAIRVMVFNRLCDADSKLGTLRWLQTVSMPGVDADKLSHQQLLRSMDALMDHQGAVNDTMAHLLRTLIDEELSVVFYDLTTIRAEGLSERGGDVRRFGMSKEGLIARLTCPLIAVPVEWK